MSVNALETARARRALLAAVAVAALGSPAFAQSERLEEIVVTARKREVDLQHAPLAVSAVSGEDFQRSNLVRLENLNGHVPGLTIAKNDGAGRVAAIRGIGWETAQNLSTQPGVLVYLDGVYVANPLSLGTDLADIERVEVFRGPQGTEFGQGTTGGAINLVMKKPDLSALSGDVELAAGTYDAITARGSLNVPFGERLAARGSVQRLRRRGFAQIAGGALDGYELDDADSITATAALRWEPTDRVSLDLSAFAQDSDQHAAAQKSADDPSADPRRLTQDFPGAFALRNVLWSTVLEWRGPTAVIVRSLTGFQRLEKDQSVDGDRLNEALTSIDLEGLGEPASWDVLTFWDNDSDAFSQELNVSRRGQRADWVLGAYYLDHENFNHFLEANGPSPFTDYADELANPSPQTLPPFASVLNFIEARRVTREDWALYAQSTLRLSEWLALTAGLRWQDEQQTDEAVQFFTNASRQHTNDAALTWKVGLDVDLAEDHLLYALVSTGWKNGGTNPGALAGALQVPTGFEPEELTAFEIGSRNVFFGDRLRFNVVGFYYEHENLQFMQEDPVPFASGTGNVPESEIHGIEVELNWLLAPAWRVDAHFAWMQGKIVSDVFTLDVVDFREALAPGVGLFTPAGLALRIALSETTNLRGNEPPKLVDLTSRVALSHERTFGSGARLVARADYIHRGEYQYRVFNHPLADHVPAYDVLGLYFRYEPPDSAFAFSLSATNVADEDGVNSRFSNPFGLLTTSEEYIPPREIIATVSYDF